MAEALLGGADGADGAYEALGRESAREYADRDGLLSPAGGGEKGPNRERCARVSYFILMAFTAVFVGVAVGVPEWLQHEKAAEEDPGRPEVDWDTNVGLWRICHQVDGALSETCLAVSRVCGDGGELAIVAPYNETDPAASPTPLLVVSASDMRGFCSVVDGMRAATIIALVAAGVALLLPALRWHRVPASVAVAVPAVAVVCLVVAASLAKRMNSKLTGGKFDYGASFGVTIASAIFSTVAAAVGPGAARKRVLDGATGSLAPAPRRQAHDRYGFDENEAL